MSTATEHRQFSPTTIRGVDREKRTVDIVASDFSLDSYGTRIDPAGWDLAQFTKNPAICLQHDSYDDLPVANAVPETVRVEAGQLRMTIQFPPEGTSEDSDEAFNLIAAGVLRGVSVGFMPLDYEQIDEDGKKVTVYRKQKLMEVSFVTIPSNDNGLVVRTAATLNQDPKALRKMLRDMEDKLKEHQEEAKAREDLSKYTARHLLTCVQYMERKQPANKEATRVLKLFFTRVLKEEPPESEPEAWQRMAEGVEALDETPAEQPKPAEPAPVEVEAVEPVTPPVEAPIEQPTPSPVPAAQEQPRAALARMSIDDLMALPAKLAKSYLDAAEEALRRGIPVKDVAKLIDGMNTSVISSLSKL